MYALNQHFSVFTHDGETTLLDVVLSSYPGLPDIDISITQFTRLLKEINPYKVTGPDCIPAKLLKEMAEELSPSLVSSLQQGKIPQDWKEALITPLLRRTIKPTI